MKLCGRSGRRKTNCQVVAQGCSPVRKFGLVQVIYELTQKDFFESLIAHRNRTTLRKWFYRLLLAITLLLAGAGLPAVFRNNTPTLSNFAPLLFLSALMWGSPWWSARLQFRKQPAAQGRQTVLLDADGVHGRGDTGQSDVEWRSFIRWLECKNQILIYSSPVYFIIIPKRALTPDQLTEIRGLLAQNIGSK